MKWEYRKLLKGFAQAEGRPVAMRDMEQDITVPQQLGLLLRISLVSPMGFFLFLHHQQHTRAPTYRTHLEL